MLYVVCLIMCDDVVYHVVFCLWFIAILCGLCIACFFVFVFVCVCAFYVFVCFVWDVSCDVVWCGYLGGCCV